MKVNVLQSASVVALALVMQLSFTAQTNGEKLETAEATKLAMRRSARSPDPTHPPARETVALVEQLPCNVVRRKSGELLIDFGQVAFGNLQITDQSGFQGVVTVRFGEKLAGDAIDRKPPGTVRFSEVAVQLDPRKATIIAPPADKRNTQQSGEVRRAGPTPPAVLTPPEWGVVTPFRWVEIAGLPTDFATETIVRRAAFPKHWDEDSASFECSDELLNRVWELCRYSIKATMFAGVYVDGDRERIPYEADAYLNQLTHYCVDHETSMARETFDWLIAYPTWPTEWGPHMVFMAHADWMRNGDVDWLALRYESLKSKTLIERCRASGLVYSNQSDISWNDIVDWPRSERDGYVRSEINTVVNAFHIAAIEKMAELAAAVGADEDARFYQDHAQHLRPVFQDTFFDAKAGLFRDGKGVGHYSQHANFFPLAFGLVEEEHRQEIADWLAERGMRCSVYAAQYLLEGLFESDAGQDAVALMIAPGQRSWRHMLDSDATVTWESWNENVKPNLDWNHAWGAAPANLLPRYVIGAQAITPGWSRAKIRPHTSGLEFARGTVPTPNGPVIVDWRQTDNFQMKLRLPEGMAAEVHVPAMPETKEVLVNGEQVEVVLNGGYWILRDDIIGEATIQTR